MKIFNKDEGWESKVNFVDDNNVLVGYDTHQDCCEQAGWFLSLTEDNEIKEDTIKDVEGYQFDVKYFVDVEPKQEGCEDYKYSCLDSGRMIRFRLTLEGKPDVFLHIYNSHNGYYGHGFEAKIGGLKWQEGTL